MVLSLGKNYLGISLLALAISAPVTLVAAGKIKSWGWLSHQLGGKYRRLSTMTANNYGDLFKAWGEILEEIYGDGENAEANEFSEI